MLIANRISFSTKGINGEPALDEQLSLHKVNIEVQHFARAFGEGAHNAAFQVLQHTLGMLLGKAGYRAVTRGSRNARVRGWIVYQRNTDEINANKALLAKDGVTM